jgi:hypothetical protein
MRAKIQQKPYTEPYDLAVFEPETSREHGQLHSRFIPFYPLASPVIKYKEIELELRGKIVGKVMGVG